MSDSTIATLRVAVHPKAWLSATAPTSATTAHPISSSIHAGDRTDAGYDANRRVGRHRLQLSPNVHFVELG